MAIGTSCARSLRRRAVMMIVFSGTLVSPGSAWAAPVETPAAGTASGFGAGAAIAVPATMKVSSVCIEIPFFPELLRTGIGYSLVLY